MRGLPDAVKKVKFTNEELPWQLFFWAFHEPILMLLQPSDSDDSNLNDIVNFNIMWREFSKMQWGRLSLWDMNYLDSAIFFRPSKNLSSCCLYHVTLRIPTLNQ